MSDAQPTKKEKVKLVPAGVWRCPRCGSQVSVDVDMTCPPACGNHKGGHFAIMEIVQKKGK